MSEQEHIECLKWILESRDFGEESTAAIIAGMEALEREGQIKAKIAEIEDAYHHVLTGSIATVFENAPRALQQVAAESKLEVLCWSIGKEYQSQLKGK